MGVHTREQRQGQPRPHTADFDQFAKQTSILLDRKAIEQLRILTHNHMRQQHHFAAQRRQLEQRGHWHL